ncbi:MAG: GTPase Era [Acidobacteria bacterium]|nr:GTPase Era [Acidobacteriota bacterium]
MKVGYVALIGRPNAGKSTLINTLVGEKVAIISDKPQTTRTSILGIKTTDRGQIIFVDNPGIHKPLHQLNRRMMNFVYSSLETANVLCLIVDAGLKYGHGDEFVIETLEKVSTPIILCLNKVDALKKAKVLLLIDRYKDLLPFKEIIPISALRGTQVDVLEDKIYAYMPEAEKLYDDDDLTVQSDRFLFSEIIREKILARVREELPFTTAVYIESIEDRERSPESTDMRPRKYIRATIYLEKDGHRKIILGKQGSNIRDIGSEARREIEAILEARIFLDLKVKVKERWRDSDGILSMIEGQ